jgi:hypothetical protein
MSPRRQSASTQAAVQEKRRESPCGEVVGATSLSLDPDSELFYGRKTLPVTRPVQTPLLSRQQKAEIKL